MLSAVKLWKSSSISGPSATVEAERTEQRLDALERARDRVQAAAAAAAARQRHVERFGGELPRELRVARARRAAPASAASSASWPR